MLQTVLRVGYGDVVAQSHTERIYSVLVAMFVMYLVAYILSGRRTLALAANSHYNEFILSRQNTVFYMRDRELPKEVAVLILLWRSNPVSMFENQREPAFARELYQSQALSPSERTSLADTGRDNSSHGRQPVVERHWRGHRPRTDQVSETALRSLPM